MMAELNQSVYDYRKDVARLQGEAAVNYRRALES